MTVVVATRDRRDTLLATVVRLTTLGVPIIVVDNGSRDGSVDALRDADASVRLIALDANRGAAARNLGVQLADTPYVAFADDDSWWAPSSLERAAAILDDNPSVALVAARTLVGGTEAMDPLSRLMEQSPIGNATVAGTRRILGFAACSAIVRRDVFLLAGGFHPRFLIGGEEELLALDLRTAGWELVYVPHIVAYHHPEPRTRTDHSRRRRYCARNTLWTVWLRYPARLAMHETIRVAARALHDRVAREGLVDALPGLFWVLRSRRPVSGTVKRELLQLRCDRRASSGSQSAGG